MESSLKTLLYSSSLGLTCIRFFELDYGNVSSIAQLLIFIFSVFQFCRGEYGAFWKCFQAGCIYVFTQLVKMLILATFFPTSDAPGIAGLDYVTVSTAQ